MPNTLRTLALAALALSLAVIGYVLFSEHVQGYEPCELCLRERLPWYGAIAVSLFGIVFPSRWIIGAVALLLLVSAGLGLHHSGVEQHWWPGPTACTGGNTGANSIDELRAMMHQQRIVQCDAIGWTFLGLSMATWNFIVSLIAALAFITLLVRGRHAR
ncbi:MAG TPA: disulfide bond formation protein B [Alphaproteobacteria bacterium]|jgi:disulfide bond formation protein DsbB|nr:disulfide bond formation protein B [Alphaproteobacteria bacterium]